MVLEHFRLAAEGQDLTGNWKKWRAEGGPVDKRSKTGQMSYASYLRMLQRTAYTGRWQFCRTRNTWSGNGDLTQVPQPAEEIQNWVCEELRIVPDALFEQVQARLRAQALGPRPRRTRTRYQLWDLVIGVFACQACRGRRYHMAGSHGQYMRCPTPECPAHAMVHRERAVTIMCTALAKQLVLTDFPDLVLASFASLSDTDQDALDLKIAATERQLRQLANKVSDLEDLLGVGTDEQRRLRRDQIKAVASQQAAAQAELAALRRCRRGGREQPVTRQQVVDELQDLLGLLNDAAAGTLGPEVVPLAADVFRRLVGGQVQVQALRRAGRKDWIVTGTFVPDLLRTLRQRLGAEGSGAAALSPVTVELVPPPFVDRIAPEVQQMYDVEQLGFRIINRKLEEKYGRKIGTGNCCAARRRGYELQGLPVPPARTDKGGRRRKAARP